MTLSRTRGARADPHPLAHADKMFATVRQTFDMLDQQSQFQQLGGEAAPPPSSCLVPPTISQGAQHKKSRGGARRRR